jgi:hypothetical protein
VRSSLTEQIPMTGSRGQPLKMAQYLEEGKKLMEAVVAYRAARDEASVEELATQEAERSASDVTDSAPVPTKPKRKSYPLPPLETPSEIPGYPLSSSPPRDIPDYGSIGRLKATRAAQAERRGKRAPLAPSGPSELRKRGDVRTWKVAE